MLGADRKENATDIRDQIPGISNRNQSIKQASFWDFLATPFNAFITFRAAIKGLHEHNSLHPSSQFLFYGDNGIRAVVVTNGRISHATLYQTPNPLIY